MLAVFIQMIYTKSGFCPQSRRQNAKVKENAVSGSSLASQHMSLENIVTLGKVQTSQEGRRVTPEQNAVIRK